MQLDFLSPQQLEMALKLSDILSMEDLTVAAAILASYNWSIETALNQMQLGQLPAPPQNNYNEPHYQQQQDNQEANPFQEENNYEYEGQTFEEKKKYFEEEHPSLVPLQHTISEPTKNLSLLDYHKMIAKESKAHRGKYMLEIMKRSQTVCQSILNTDSKNKQKYTQSRIKVLNNGQFINTLYKNYQPRINFTFGTFFLNLTRSYLEGKHLLVYIHSINPEIQSRYDRVIGLLLRQKQLANFVNENCITYGMFDNSDDYEILQKYVTPKELPAFAVFRMNKSTRQEQFVSSYVVSTQKDIFLEWLADCIGIKLKKKSDDGTVEKKEDQKKPPEKSNNEIHQKQKENFNAHSYLRAQQDELYFELEKTYNQKRQLSLERRQKIKQDEENLQERIKEALKEKEPESSETTIEIKFRMPISGDPKTRRFTLTDKVQKCFQFVDCFCRDDFEEKFSNFELLQSHPTLILSNFKQKTLEEVFAGSKRENIMIRQI